MHPHHRPDGTSNPLHPLSLAVLLALTGSLFHQAAWAQLASSSQATAYDLPGGPLDATLTGIARRAGRIIVIDPALVAGRTSAPVRGNLTTEQAFAQALTGTELEIARSDERGYTLKKAPPVAGKPEATAPLGAPMLPMVTVSAGAGQETATGPVDGYVARRSSTGTKTDTATREIPQSISVVTRDVLDARGASSLAEALEYTPGFTPMTYGRDDRYDWSIARGIGTTYGANYRDGLKEVGGAYAVPRLNSYGVERVEFLRGPASLLVGSNAPGGVVNSITKRPTQETQRAIRLRAGDLDRQGVAADLSGPLNEDGTVLYRMVALTEHYDLPTPQTDKDQRYFAPSLTLRLSRDTELTLLADVQQEKIKGDAYPYSYDEAFGRYVSVVERGRDRFYRDQWSGGFLLDHRFSDALSFHSRTRYTNTKLDYRRSFPASIPSGTLVERAAQDMQDEGKAWQSDNFVEGKWSVGKWANTTIAGLDLSKVEGAMYRGVGMTSPYDLSTGQGVGAYIAPELVPFQLSKSRQAGLYVQNQAKFDNQFVVVAGLRQDRYRETVIASWADAPIRQNKVTGRLGGVWLLANGLSPYVSYSTSFEPQSGASFDGTPFKPTSGRQYEVGLRYEPKGTNAMISAAVFDISQRNVSVTDPLRQDFSVQRGQVGSRGLELEANASLSRGLDVTASYSYTNAKVTEDTNPALVGRKNGLVPAHKAAVWLNYRVPADLIQGLKLGLGIRYTGKVPDYDNVRWVPRVTLVDARVGYQVNRQWEISLNARNLFDKKHLVNCSYGSCYPGDEREFVATANYRW